MQQRSFWVVIKDFEQEACFVLAFWVFAIMALKAKLVMDIIGQAGLPFVVTLQDPDRLVVSSRFDEYAGAQ